MRNDSFPVVNDLKPDEFYKSKKFEVTEDGEITSDEPIQVRINNGPWVNVRPSQLNTNKNSQ